MAKTWSEIGEEQGRLEEQLRIVRKQLEAKFKTTLSPATQQRLAARTPEELDQILDNVFTANSLKELGLED